MDPPRASDWSLRLPCRTSSPGALDLEDAESEVRCHLRDGLRAQVCGEDHLYGSGGRGAGLGSDARNGRHGAHLRYAAARYEFLRPPLRSGSVCRTIGLLLGSSFGAAQWTYGHSQLPLSCTSKPKKRPRWYLAKHVLRRRERHSSC